MPITDSISSPLTLLPVSLQNADGLDSVCLRSYILLSDEYADICHTGRVEWTKGIEPEHRNELPGYNSAVMTIVIAVFFIITLNFRHYTTFLKTFTHNLFSVRPRANVFDERATMSEARVLLSLILLLCVCEGLRIFSALRLQGVSIDNFTGIASLTALAGVYYLFQIAAYKTVGYVFTTPRRASMWLKGFNSSQALLSLFLTAPSLILLFNPSIARPLLLISAALYILARIIFISKGFRIFYQNSLSLIYFILYLCTLEIIPLILIYKASLFLTSIL